MIGLDANVLVRYLVRDDPAQTARADRLIESHCTPEHPFAFDTAAASDPLFAMVPVR